MNWIIFVAIISRALIDCEKDRDCDPNLADIMIGDLDQDQIFKKERDPDLEHFSNRFCSTSFLSELKFEILIKLNYQNVS